MRKIKVYIILMIVIVTFMSIISTKSYAEGKANAEVNITANTQKIEDKQSTIELMISLGALENLSSTNGKIILGYEATLNYDSNMVESATIEGLNGWNVIYEASTKKIVGDTGDAKANTNTAKIVLKLKENIPDGTSGKISIKNLLLTDGTNDFSFSKDITIEKKSDNTTNNETNKETNNTTNSETNNTNMSNTQKTNNSTTSGNNTTKANLTTNTKAITKLPAAGLNNTIILAIVIAIIASIIFKFKSRKIKY